MAKAAARPLSRAICSGLFYKPARLAEVYLNFLMGKGAGTGWDLAREVGAASRRVKRPNPILFDVGANLGCWTEGMLQQFPTAKVFMFDPSPGCQAAIRAKNLPSTSLIPCALANRQASPPFTSVPRLTAAARSTFAETPRFEN